MTREPDFFSANTTSCRRTNAPRIPARDRKSTARAHAAACRGGREQSRNGSSTRSQQSKDTHRYARLRVRSPGALTQVFPVSGHVSFHDECRGARGSIEVVRQPVCADEVTLGVRNESHILAEYSVDMQ